MHSASGCCMTRCFPSSVRIGALWRPSMASKYFDPLVSIRKVRRAEATLLRRASEDLSALERSELLEYTRALSTVLVAAQHGLRLAPEVFAVAELLAYSPNPA